MTAGVKAEELWLAPAKINLWLDILGRRDDGYHLLDTAFQTIDLADVLTLEPSDRPGVTCRVTGEAAKEVPDGGENLAARAATLLAERTGHDLRVAITIEKRIPAGAGLGGGSSDAAAVLTALARRFAVPDPARTLHDLGSELGADVPFLLVGGTALGRGIGDALTFVDPPSERHGILVLPETPVSTGWAYRSWDPQADRAAAYGVESPRPAGASDVRGWAERENDLERLVVARYGEVMVALAALRHGPAVASRMTGSGSAVFGLYASREERDGDLPRVEEALEGVRARAVAFETVPHGVRRLEAKPIGGAKS